MIFPIVLSTDNGVSIIYKALKDRNGKVSGACGLHKALKLSFKTCVENVFVYIDVYKKVNEKSQKSVSFSKLSKLSKLSEMLTVNKAYFMSVRGLPRHDPPIASGMSRSMVIKNSVILYCFVSNQNHNGLKCCYLRLNAIKLPWFKGSHTSITENAERRKFDVQYIEFI